jgi:hypothetical protein
MFRLARCSLLFLLGSQTASAGDWGHFAPAFPLFPCADGWVACQVEGRAQGPDLVAADGVPAATNARISWFDLEPTLALSPFVGLSNYTGEAYEEPEPPEPPARPAASPTPRTQRPAVAHTRPDSRPARPEPLSPEPVSPEPVSPEPEQPIDAVAVTELAPAAPVAVTGDCENLVVLEPMAVLGKLTGEQTDCLEAHLAASPKQTDRDKISRVLLANAYSKGDADGWASLMKRHLNTISQSDPDLCYKYALHLTKKGVWMAPGVIKWANLALENRTVWTGDMHVNRVHALRRMKALAAQKLWKSAADKHATAPTATTEDKLQHHRDQTKVLAREWYEYAREVGKDTSVPLQLCDSAASNEAYCQAV